MSREDSPHNASMQAVMNFIMSNVPKKDIPNVEMEAKKGFVLSKSKSKQNKRTKPKRKKNGLTRNQKKTLGFYNQPRNLIQYADVIPINNIWENYMEQLLGKNMQIPTPNSKGWENITQTLYKADFHGCRMHVVRSKCPGFVGKMGICVMDTRNTFKIVSENNIATTIPKKDSVFEISFKDMKFTIFGHHLCTRPADRTSKKVKGHSYPDFC
ncbi:ribonuclease P protein subunit p29 [Galleria mellonella]|uniref:Ribonuclease P protein subunit p29 n=1 Tax=Galleria mellonella TaxID=7137 RepID=A0A6J3BVH6_GALME|nr:ribonuclease P protein subunit p29 [Galleria mellonella]